VPPVARCLKLEPYLDRRFFSFSTGIKRRFDIARGLLHQPNILMLDEPTTNLDPLATQEVRQLLAQLRDQGKTIIMVTHRLEEVAKMAGRLAIMKEGCLQEVQLEAGQSLEDLYRQVVLGETHAAA
jgi:ABC-2 type transport system ATP-binding protein